MNNRSISLEVAAIVPFSDGGDEVLVVEEGGSLSLPSGTPPPGELLAEAAERIVREQTGLKVTPNRLLYVMEQEGGKVVLGMLCDVQIEDEDAEDLTGVVASLSILRDRDFQPMGLLEILMEDLRSGFVRPVAHIVETTSADGRGVQVNW